MKFPSSRALVKKWLSSTRLDMNDFVIPPGGYKNFNAFFGRKLKPGARPVSGKGNDNVIVSPSDGYSKLLVAQVKNNDALEVKGDFLDIREIFNNQLVAQKFIGGPVIEMNLFPRNYHHFHAPVSGKILYSDIFSGLRSAEDGWEKTTFNHARGVYIFYNHCLGYVGMVPIGFWMVGSIHLIKKTGDYVKKGDEVGHFELGSSILLFFEHGRIIVDKKQQVPIKTGQPLAHARFSCKKSRT